MDLSFDSGYGDWQATHRASQVCTYWRAMLFSIPSIWQSVQIVEKDLGDSGMRGAFAEYITELRSRNKNTIKNVKLLLGETQVPGVAIRTLIGSRCLEKIVVKYTDAFQGPFFVPPPCKVVEASAGSEGEHALILQKNHFESVTLHNVLPWSTHFDQDLSNGLTHLYLDLDTVSSDTMAGYTISQCKDLETLHVKNLKFKLNIPITLTKLKKLSLVDSSSALRFFRTPAIELLILHMNSVEEEEKMTLFYSVFSSLRHMKLNLMNDLIMSDGPYEELEIAELYTKDDNNLVSLDCFLHKLLSDGAARKLKALRTMHHKYSVLRNMITDAAKHGVQIEELIIDESPFRHPRLGDMEAIDWFYDNIPKFKYEDRCNYDSQDSYFPLTF